MVIISQNQAEASLFSFPLVHLEALRWVGEREKTKEGKEGFQATPPLSMWEGDVVSVAC